MLAYFNLKSIEEQWQLFLARPLLALERECGFSGLGLRYRALFIRAGHFIIEMNWSNANYVCFFMDVVLHRDKKLFTEELYDLNQATRRRRVQHI